MARGQAGSFTALGNAGEESCASESILTTSAMAKRDPRVMPNAKEQLEVYLQDHYAGAVGALELITHSIEAHEDTPLAKFFEELHGDVKSDHEQLHHLMTALGFEPSGTRNAGAWVAEKLGRLKVGFSGGESSELRLLQTLEGLYLGISGKRLLWRALRAAAASSPILQKTDFASLEQRAIEQAERVEAQRLAAARLSLGS